MSAPDPAPTDLPFDCPSDYGYLILDQRERTELDAMTLGPRETICPKCFTVHAGECP